MARIAILYDSAGGQTAKIASKIAEIATAANHSVELRDIGSLPTGVDLEEFQAIILGAAIHIGKHSRRMLSPVENGGASRGKTRTKLAAHMRAFP